MELKNISTEQLKQELKNRGYQTNNLWHIDDVKHCSCEVSDTDAMMVLECVMNSEWVIDNLFENIREELEDAGYDLENN